MRKLILIVSAVFVFVLNATAQNRTVTGKVTDEKGAPLEGVSVTSANGKQGTQTGKDGMYSISVPESVKNLTFSNVTFVPQSISIGKNTVLNIGLRSVDSKLEEVVVVGYGTQKRKEVTGSLTAIKGTVIAEKPVQSFEQALAGRSSGVQITVPSGVLNAPPVFRIRGTNSLSLNSSPLIIVDGTPVTTGDLAGSNAAGNALASINPADIESIDIAKDAAATAIYGSRAANGVVFITTKRGKAGKTKINYNVSMGFTTPYGVPEVLNAQQYTDYKNFVASTSLGVNTTNPANPGFTRFNLTTGPDGNPINTNWGNVVYRQGFSQDHNLNVSGGSENTTYYFSAGYTNQEGILRNNDFVRKNILMNVDSRVSKYLSIGGKISYSNELNRVAAATGSLGDAFATGGFGRLALVNSPNVSPYNNDGSYNLSTAGNFIGQQGNTLSTGQVGFTNPAFIFDKNRSNSETNHIQSNVNITVKPLSWLTFKSLYGVDYIFVDNDIFRDARHGDGVTNSGDAFASLSKFKRWTWSNTLQIDKTFKDKHSFSLLGGLEQDRRTTNQFGLTRRVVTDPVYNVIQGGFTTDVNTNLGLGENYLQSQFGRFNYNYKKKYFISANVRSDEYSAIPKARETFYGFSAAWEVTEEKFWGPNIRKVFSSLKLQGSYGKVGNTAGIGDFETYSTFNSVGAYGTLPILTFNNAGNPNLKWETSKQLNIGANIGFFKDKINLEVTYYKNDISNLILRVPQAPSTGLPNSPLQNVGKMYNKGIELTLSGNIINTKNFTWTTNFNYTNNRNEVTALAPGLSQILTITGNLETVNRTAVGYPAGYLWVVRSGGADPATGRRILYNKVGNTILYRFGTLPTGEFNFQNTDGTRYNNQTGGAATINQAADAVMYANTNPKAIGGFSNTFRYKNFDMDVLFTYQAGFSLYYGTNAGLHDQRFWNNSVDVLNGWRKVGDITNIPRPVFNDNVSNGSGLPISFNVFKGDFIKLKNLTFGYNFPVEGLKKVKITNVRFYASGQNLFIFTKYPGPDPEVSSNGNGASTGQGVDRNTLANGRTMTVGLNIGF
ncbi:MAG: SusC/RagA family TonB-linked outer membrane protein [Chitinophagaceae bacterium]|nr:SusC/RagA family TonB-linked outer membrane protein [Chitinophagaceae bacterium]